MLSSLRFLTTLLLLAALCQFTTAHHRLLAKRTTDNTTHRRSNSVADLSANRGTQLAANNTSTSTNTGGSTGLQCVACPAPCNYSPKGMQFIPLEPPSSSRLKAIFSNVKDLKQSYAQVLMQRMDSSRVDFSIVKQQDERVHAKVVRMRYFNQIGDFTDHFYYIAGLDTCRGSLTGPPNTYGHVLLNVAIFDYLGK